MAARTVGAASDPTDVPVSTVSLARSAREVRAHLHFYVETICYGSLLSASFKISLCRCERGWLLLAHTWYVNRKTKGCYYNYNLPFILVVLERFHIRVI